MSLVDSHAHLDFDDYGPDLDQVLARATEADVESIVCIGSGREVASARGAVALASIRERPRLFATVGIHPHDARIAGEEAIEAIRDLTRKPRVVAVGEVGLDYHYDHSPRDVQRQVFARFVALAREVRLPLVVHTRSAAEDTLEILRAENAAAVGGVIHCFTEDIDFARAAVDLGFHVSFSGIVTFKKSEALRGVAAALPLDRILVETDSPYLAPEPHRGKRNEPAFVRRVVETIAKARGAPFETVAEATTANARRLFRLPAPQSL